MQMLTLLLRHYPYSGLEFSLDISRENLVLEHSMITLVIVLPHFLSFTNGRCDSWGKKGEKRRKEDILKPEKVFGLDSDFDKIYLIVLEWFLWWLSLSARRRPSHRRKQFLSSSTAYLFMLFSAYGKVCLLDGWEAQWAAVTSDSSSSKCLLEISLHISLIAELMVSLGLWQSWWANWICQSAPNLSWHCA